MGQRNLLAVGAALVLGYQVGLFVGTSQQQQQQQSQTSSSSWSVANPPPPASLRIHQNLPPAAAVATTTTPRSLPPGWKDVYIYNGGALDLLLQREDYTRAFLPHSPSHPRWSGQIRQDALIHALVLAANRQAQEQQKSTDDASGTGFFVELAANDAVYLSNTFALEQYYGWTGICIEGNPVYWYPLSFRNCTVVGAMAGRTTGEILTVDFTGAETGGIVHDIIVNANARRPTHEQRRTTTLTEILDMVQAPSIIDWLSLDAEGAEEMIMEAFAFDRYTFRLLTIERPSPRLHTVLQQRGYEELRHIAAFGETLWKHSASMTVLSDAAIRAIVDEWCTHTNPDRCS